MTGHLNGSEQKVWSANRVSQFQHGMTSRKGPNVEKHSADVVEIALLTGGGDKPYALGIAAALTSGGVSLDFIGSDDLQVPDLLNNSRVNFLNLRGDQRPEVAPLAKVLRVLTYYIKLLRYAAMARPRIFHILWHNKFVWFDRMVLLAYYRLLGKKVVLTAHN